MPLLARYLVIILVIALHKLGRKRAGEDPAEQNDGRRTTSISMRLFMIMKTLKVTSGGQISVPAEIRRRWGTSTLALEDLGDRVVLTPAPDDPIAAARGALAGESTTDAASPRRAAREAQGTAERRHGRDD
ncbi:MAG: hypothetical protein V7607_5603 [Solirubrobacteraceae bacterium]